MAQIFKFLKTMIYFHVTRPVVYLIQMELDIAALAEVVGDYNISANFLDASKAREEAMRSVLWNAEMGQWLDYWLTDSTCKVFVYFV